MPTPIYDDQKNNTDDLNAVTGIDKTAETKMEQAAHSGARQDIAAREGRGGMYNPNDGSDKKPLSNSELAGKESAQPTAAAGSLFKADDNSAGSKRAMLLSGIGGRLKKAGKNKLLIGAAIFGGASTGFIVLMIILFLGLFKIPNLAEHIVSYQAARTTRDYAQRANNANMTAIGIDSADDKLWPQLKAKYYDTRLGKAQTKVTDTWAKLDKYRPQKVIDNMQRDQKLSFETTKSPVLQRERLTKIVVNGQDIPVDNLSFFNRLDPTAQFRADSQLSAQLRPTLRAAIAADDIGPLVRGLAMRKIRQQLGISLIAWHIDKLKNTTDKEARLAIEEENYRNLHGNNTGINPAASDGVNQTAEQTTAAELADVENKTTLQTMIDHPNELSPGVLKVLQTAFAESGMKSIFNGILGFLNPLYAVAAPVCMVYEGSLSNNGATINAEDASSQRAGVEVMAAGSQVKDGYDVNGQAAGAFGAKLGQIEQSNPEIRASGGTVDTTKSISSQSSPTGEFSIYNAILPSPLGNIFNNISGACPVITNVWAGLGLTAINVFGMFASGVTSVPSEATADVAVTSAIKVLISKLVVKLLATKTFAASFAKNLIVVGGLTAGATFLARWYVLKQMGSAQTNPLLSGSAFVNNADAGANSHFNTTERTMLKGAPLSAPDVASNNVADQEFRSNLVSKQSPFQRYLALGNANSLVNHIGSTISGQLNGSAFSSVINMIGTALNPLHTLSLVGTALSPARAFAGTTDTYNYGNVQFGFTPQEQHILDTDPTFINAAENQLLLDESGKQDEIAKRFDPCYDLTKGIGDLETAKTGESGDTEYYIVRDSSGNISATQGLCSQRFVGPYNNQYGPGMVFRYRVAGGYDSTLTQLDEEQNPTATDAPLGGTAPAAPGGTVGTLPTGTAQQLAQQILDSPNLSFQTPTERSYFAQVALTGSENACGGTVPISTSIMAVILAASAKYKIVIGVLAAGHDCIGGYHRLGMAADLNGVSTLDGSVTTGNRIAGNSSGTSYALTDAQTVLLKQFYGDYGALLVQAGGGGLGQQQCFQNGPPPKVAGVIYFDDSCDHLHTDVGKR